MKTETIAAVATAMSNSGIGIIRISGDGSLIKNVEILMQIQSSCIANNCTD